MTTSPRFLSEIQGSGIDPCTSSSTGAYVPFCSFLDAMFAVKIGSFESLKTMAVGGAVLTPAMFEWTHKTFGGNFYLASISGGTDTCASCEYILIGEGP